MRIFFARMGSFFSSHKKSTIAVSVIAAVLIVAGSLTAIYLNQDQKAKNDNIVKVGDIEKTDCNYVLSRDLDDPKNADEEQKKLLAENSERIEKLMKVEFPHKTRRAYRKVVDIQRDERSNGDEKSNKYVQAVDFARLGQEAGALKIDGNTIEYDDSNKKSHEYTIDAFTLLIGSFDSAYSYSNLESSDDTILVKPKRVVGKDGTPYSIGFEAEENKLILDTIPNGDMALVASYTIAHLGEGYVKDVNEQLFAFLHNPIIIEYELVNEDYDDDEAKAKANEKLAQFNKEQKLITPICEGSFKEQAEGLMKAFSENPILYNMCRMYLKKFYENASFEWKYQKDLINQTYVQPSENGLKVSPIVLSDGQGCVNEGFIITATYKGKTIIGSGYKDEPEAETAVDDGETTEANTASTTKGATEKPGKPAAPAPELKTSSRAECGYQVVNPKPADIPEEPVVPEEKPEEEEEATVPESTTGHETTVPHEEETTLAPKSDNNILTKDPKNPYFGGPITKDPGKIKSEKETAATLPDKWEGATVPKGSKPGGTKPSSKPAHRAPTEEEKRKAEQIAQKTGQAVKDVLADIIAAGGDVKKPEYRPAPKPGAGKPVAPQGGSGTKKPPAQNPVDPPAEE